MEAEAITEETKKEDAQKAPQQAAAAAAPMAKPLEPTKRPRREDRNRKDDRNYEMFLKAVNAAPPGEQVNIASQKYLAMLDENKKMQFYIKQLDKHHAIILKEKEQLQLEFNKTVLLKSKLENLCRELQKQNKCIKEESLHKIREEEERRKETQAKFQSTLAEISTLLQQNNEKNAKLRDDNIGMTEKFKTVVKQYQLREDQVEKMSKQMELESQLNAAKMQKASLEHQAERERMLTEIKILNAAVVQYKDKIHEMVGTETGLRGQLAVYTDKYDEFQSALMKSNQVFGGFKDQMEKMSKKIKKLEKESLSWKQRWETSQSALLDMCGERQAGDVRTAAVQRQLTHMQSLCRTLQAERTVLLSTLKDHNIERPPLPTPEPAPPAPPVPAPAPASDDKVDAMAANCAQLRQSLAHLQSQLNVLTTQQPQPADETPADKPKKTKNKKNKSKKVTEESTEIAEPKAEVNVENAAAENSNGLEGDIGEKVNDTVLASLMEAINIANVDDLEVVDENTTIEEIVTGEASTESEPKPAENGVDIEVKEDSPIESPKQSPKKSPKASPKKAAVNSAANKVIESEIPTAGPLPETQVIGPEAQVIGLETKVIGPETQVIGPETQVIGPETQVIGPETQVIAPETQVIGPETQVIEPVIQVTEEVSNSVANSQTVINV